MPLIFGVASMCMGVVLVVKVSHMPVMVLSVILGALLGELCYLEKGIGKLGSKARNLVELLVKSDVGDQATQEQFLQSYVAIIVLFCASGTGIFGSMHEGMTGDASVLIAKSFLDLFTAAIFATMLGYAVAIVAVPQLIIQLLLAYGAVFILPLTTPAMQADFSAIGGVLSQPALEFAALKYSLWRICSRHSSLPCLFPVYGAYFFKSVRGRCYPRCLQPSYVVRSL